MSVRIIVGDVRDKLRELPDESVHCVVTSPPYWRQRDYGNLAQIGLETTPEQYIAQLVPIFTEARRVLRKDGVCWINIGDKWASGGNGGGGSFMADRGEAWGHAKDAKGWRSPPSGYKDKDLLGLPFMLAFAMRADGWFWRQCNVWAKPNCMPESVSDRSTIAHEYVLQFTKNNDYWFDADAVRTAPAASTETRLRQDVENQAGSERANGGAKTNGTMKAVGRRSDKQRGHSRRHSGFNERWDQMERADQVSDGANLRSVWWISPAQSGEAHFAMMPNKLAEICILAGCPNGGTVLDPFFGAGTTGLVADRLGRDCIGIELNPEYAGIAGRRIHADGPLFSRVTTAGDGAQPIGEQGKLPSLGKGEAAGSIPAGSTTKANEINGPPVDRFCDGTANLPGSDPD